jgi:predicted oxidoreductase (fatty acid repression mutant protein)
MSDKKVVALPPKMRSMLDKALQEQQAMQAMIQQQQRHINDLVEAAREMLDVPEGWRIENTMVGFVATDGGEDE